MTLTDVESFIVNHLIIAEGAEVFPLTLTPVGRNLLRSSKARDSKDSRGKCGEKEVFLLSPHSTNNLNSNSNLVHLFLNLPGNLRVPWILEGKAGHHQWVNNNSEGGRGDQGGQGGRLHQDNKPMPLLTSSREGNFPTLLLLLTNSRHSISMVDQPGVFRS